VALFRPTWTSKRLITLDAAFFLANKVRLLVLDIDNTLTTHDNPVPAEGVQAWINTMRAAGLILVLLSNNSPERVRPFAELLSLPFEAKAAKPLTPGLRRLQTRYGVTRQEMVLIGDQLFTDMLCGNLGGVRTVLVEPYELETHGFLAFKRKLERPFLHRYWRETP